MRWNWGLHDILHHQVLLQLMHMDGVLLHLPQLQVVVVLLPKTSSNKQPVSNQ